MSYKYHILEIKLNKINLKNIESIDDIIVEKKKENLFLSDKGLYKIIGEDIYQYKLIDRGDGTFDNFLDEYTLFYSDSYWKKNIVENIPYNYENINVIYLTVKLNEKSRNSMVIEIFNGKIIDLYFLSNMTMDDHSFKEDISLFIKMIM